MKGLLGVCAALTFISIAPGLVQAQPILAQRCAADNLDPTAAEARLAWARRCALNLHVANPNLWYPKGVSANGTGDLREYEEYFYDNNPLGANAYIGHIHYFEVNSSTIFSLYPPGRTGINQFIESSYGRWERAAVGGGSATKRARPLYPTFGTFHDINTATPLFPSANPNDCNLYTAAGAVSSIYYVNGYCESSCYTPEQKVLFPEGEVSIVDAVNAMKPEMLTLATGSTLEAISLQSMPTYSYTKELRDTKHPIVEVTTASGGKLRVTTEHPVVNGEGRLVQAQSLKVGDELLKRDGTRDPIVSVERTEHYGKVYNLRPATDDRVSNLLIAEGFVVGSSLFQNDEVGYINRLILFKAIPTESIP